MQQELTRPSEKVPFSSEPTDSQEEVTGFADLSKTVARLMGNLSDPASSGKSLSEQAYERLESLIVNCRLAPGSAVTLQVLQDMTALGRTPVYEAVRRLAADTLVTILPRSGLRIAPIDVERERTLLPVRRSLERFTAQMAVRRATPEQRGRVKRLIREMEDDRDGMSIDVFNQYDYVLDHLLLEACAEPLLNTTLRPLHTLFRRSGWMYLSHIETPQTLDQCITLHQSVLDTVASGNEEAAVRAMDRLIDLSEAMFNDLQKTVSPSLLDVEGKRQEEINEEAPWSFVGMGI